MFEGMLARKYIGAQKRHSALTICSIAIALALITMLFSVFSTAITILRNVAYAQGEYHIKITGTGYGLDKEQYDAIAEAASEYGTCTPEDVWIAEKAVFYANIMLDKSIDSASLFVNRIALKIGTDGLYFIKNSMLILLDMKDAQSGLYMAAIIAAFYVFVLFLIMMLRLIIDTAFEISSKERERQFGVLQSIGATPKQIVHIITYEGLMLSAVGISLGTAAGIGLGYLVYRAVLGTGLVDLYLSPSKAAELVHFSVNPWLLLLSVVTGAVWVMLSAYGTGMRIIKMSPVQAISQRGNTVKKVGKAPLFGKLFGWTGKIASRNNMRQPKRFIATVVSLTLSIAIFSTFTVVVNDLRSAAEDYYAERGAESDFTVYLSWGDDPLQYRADLKAIEESGLFDDVFFSSYTQERWDIPEAVDTDNIERTAVRIEYFNRNSYNSLFRGAPPVSYDELAESGGYIINERYFADHLGEHFADYLAYLNSEKNISLSFYEDRQISYSEEEYNALPPEEQEKCGSKYIKRDEDGNETYWYSYTPTYPVDLDLYCSTELSAHTGLIATLDQYENGDYLLFKNETMSVDSINCNLLNKDDYYKAIDLLEQNSIYYVDNTAEHRQFLALLASINIAAVFLSVMIALIAVVNMVNILATGILNRRGELAALQCVGMTEKELYKMTVIECLQYALTSGIAAIAVCELLMFLTGKMLHMFLDVMENLGAVISYVQPLPIIVISSLCAFIIAVAASIIPLRAMRRTSLVEQIRSVE